MNRSPLPATLQGRCAARVLPQCPECALGSAEGTAHPAGRLSGVAVACCGGACFLALECSVVAPRPHVWSQLDSDLALASALRAILSARVRSQLLSGWARRSPVLSLQLHFEWALPPGLMRWEFGRITAEMDHSLGHDPLQGRAQVLERLASNRSTGGAR